MSIITRMGQDVTSIIGWSIDKDGVTWADCNLDGYQREFAFYDLRASGGVADLQSVLYNTTPDRTALYSDIHDRLQWLAHQHKIDIHNLGGLTVGDLWAFYAVLSEDLGLELNGYEAERVRYYRSIRMSIKPVPNA